MRLIRLIPVLAVLAAGAMPAAGNPPADSKLQWPPEQRRMFDSILALPDSLWDVAEMFGYPPGSPLPPGFNRAGAIAAFRRMVRAPESLFVGPDRAHRTDAEMTATFAGHRRDFERLLAMFQADSALDGVEAYDDPVYNPPSPLPKARQAAYERLMRPLGVRFLIRQKDGVVLFRCTTTHTFDRKGYAWSRRPLKPLIQHETTEPPDGYPEVYRHIEGAWYLYFVATS